MIEVKNLVYEYPGLRALDKVSFNIERGSITALVGPNGAGKTTLMRCLAGLARPLSGSISVAGIDVIAEPRYSHRALGYLSDSFGLYASLSVRQTLRYVAAANGIEQASIDTAVIEVSTALGLGERLDQLVGQLSRGLRQRLAIGRAVAVHRLRRCDRFFDARLAEQHDIRLIDRRTREVAVPVVRNR